MWRSIVTILPTAAAAAARFSGRRLKPSHVASPQSPPALWWCVILHFCTSNRDSGAICSLRAHMCDVVDLPRMNDAPIEWLDFFFLRSASFSLWWPPTNCVTGTIFYGLWNDIGVFGNWTPCLFAEMSLLYPLNMVDLKILMISLVDIWWCFIRNTEFKILLNHQQESLKHFGSNSAITMWAIRKNLGKLYLSGTVLNIPIELIYIEKGFWFGIVSSSRSREGNGRIPSRMSRKK